MVSLLGESCVEGLAFVCGPGTLKNKPVLNVQTTRNLVKLFARIREQYHYGSEHAEFGWLSEYG